MKPYFLPIACLLVTVVVLSLGLWPFHSPKNEVAWLEDRNGAHFGRYASVASATLFKSLPSPREMEGSIEIWLQPDHVWNSATILSFYDADKLSQFSLYQSQLDLILRRERNQGTLREHTDEFTAPDVFPRSRPVFVTVTSGPQGTSVYADAVLVAMTNQLQITSDDLAGRVIIADSARQPDSWSGKLLGLAVYHSHLTPEQVARHVFTWTHAGRPSIRDDDRLTALYLFDERSGKVIHDLSQSGNDLVIPEKYQVVDKLTLEPVWTEFSMSGSYWGAVLKNIVGFIPFGFCFYGWLCTRGLKRAGLLTVALGTLVSLTIEVLQAFLPMRDSGTTDILTNTLGTWIGAASYQLLVPVLSYFAPWSPFPAPPHRDP